MRNRFLLFFIIAIFIVCQSHDNVTYAQSNVEPILKLNVQSLELGVLRLGRIHVIETNGKLVKWIGNKDVDIIVINDNGKSIIVQGLRPGNFYIFAYTAVDSIPSEPVEIRVTIKPELPNPPDPVVPPAPKDSFHAELTAAWNKETNQTKTNLPRHIQFYKWSATESRKPELNTIGDLNTAMRLEAKRQKIEGSLPHVAYVIGGYLQETLPNEINAPIGPVRSQCERALETVAEYLEKLK